MPGMTTGVAAWWHGWLVEDTSQEAWDRLAGAVAAAHVIECGPQATGGNFSGFTTVPRVEDLGYPIAEIAADGTAVITKHDDAAGWAGTPGQHEYLDPETFTAATPLGEYQGVADQVAMSATPGRYEPGAGATGLVVARLAVTAGG
jgi:hypothetical protein